MVSIIIPTYNDGAYLKACLQSIADTINHGRNAGDERVEVIVVDDGSEEILSEELSDRFSVRIIRQEHAGQSAARNRGLEAAQGGYIVFVDADDRLEPDWLELHLSAIAGADYVQSGYKRTDAQTDCYAERHVPRHRYQFTSPCMRMYRREAIEGMRFEEGMIYEDVLWSVDLWLRGLKCRMVNYAGYLYTRNPGSTTSRPHPEAQEAVIRALRKRAEKTGLRGKMLIYYTIIRLKAHFRKMKG